MITHTIQHLTIHFGAHKEGFQPKSFYSIPTQQELLIQPQFTCLELAYLITLKQTHSAHGHVITKEHAYNYRPYSLEGDYLITDQPDVCLGIATADCLPILLYDPTKNVVGIAHAGWQGTAHNIVPTMLEHMRSTFNNNPSDILVFLGPAAHSCCYEVQPDFLKNFTPNNAIVIRDNKIYFDTSTYTIELLIQAGIPAQNINRDYNMCTICDLTYCSYRRDGAQALRQMTIVTLK